MESTTPVEKLEALVEVAEHTARLPVKSVERTSSIFLEWKEFRELSKDVIDYHRGHVTETIRIFSLVSRLQKAFGEIYSSKNPRDKEWFEGTFPRFRPALDELVNHLKEEK